MPIKRAAKKAIRQDKKKHALNLRRSKAMKEAVKKIKKLVGSEKKDEAKKLLPLAQQAIDKAKKRGLIKKNNASRKQSQLARMVK